MSSAKEKPRGHTAPVGRRRKDQKARTRHQIVEVARRLFDDRGFKRTTIRLVASEAGVGLGTILTHFPDKESLLIATLLDEMENFQTLQWETMPPDAPLREQLVHLARAGFEAWLHRPALSRVMLREMLFKPGPARDHLQRLDQQAIQRLANHLEAAKKRGEVRADADTSLAARTAFSYYLSVVLFGLEGLESQQSLETDGPTSKEEHHDAVLDAMVDEAQAFTEQLFVGISATKPKGRQRQRRRKP